MTIALLFFFGLAIGSFLNVVVFRYTPEKKVFDGKRLGGRSRCPYCGHVLGAGELVPIVSFIIQKGKCRSCGHRLSFQYPLVELLSASAFAFLPLFLNSAYGMSGTAFFSAEAPLWYYGLVAAWVLTILTWIVITAIDLRHYVIPNELNAFLLILGVCITALLSAYHENIFPFRISFLQNFSLLFSFSDSVVLNHAGGMLFGGIFFALLVFLSRGRGMGFGDVKLALASGLILGWPDIALAIILSFVFGGIFGGVLILLRKKTMKDKIPFAPFLVLGFLLTIFFGHAIVGGYFRLFGL